MTLVLKLTAEQEKHVQQIAAQHGLSIEDYALQRLLETWDSADDLTEDEIVEIRAGIRCGLADVDAGRVTPFAEWVSQKRQKHGIPHTDASL